MKSFFSETPKLKNRARLAAISWTLLIFFLCLIPAKEIPDVNVPLMDKWVHFILFGVFSFLWLLSLAHINFRWLFIIFIVAVLTGWMVEELQGILGFLGRSKDIMDIVADAIGGLLGVLLFTLIKKIRPVR